MQPVKKIKILFNWVALKALKIFLITFSLMLGLSLQARTPFISEISFVSDSGEEITIDEESLKTREGESFDSQNLIKDIDTLKDNYPQFQNIMTSIEPLSPDGVEIAIRFQFQLKRYLASFRILTTEDIEMPLGLREKLNLQRNGEFNSSDLEKDKRILKNHFIENGYPKIQVIHELNQDPYNQDVDLILRIESPTKKLHVKKLKFKGRDELSYSELRSEIKTKPRALFFLKHKTFSANQLERDTKTLQNFYVEKGFLDAKVTSQYKYNDEGEVRVEFIIHEGHRYRINDIRFENTGSYPELSKKFSHWRFKNKYGQSKKTPHHNHSKHHSNPKVAYFNNQAVRKTLQEIREYLGNRGHALPKVSSFYDSYNETLIIDSQEGEQFFIEDILVEGNQNVSTKEVLLKVEIERGDLFHSEKIEKSLRKLKASGLFEEVQVEFQPTAQTSGQLIFKVKEARTKTLSFGAGTSSDGLMGELSFSDRNFLNSGNSLSLQLKQMAEMTKIALVYRDPHLFDSQNSMTVASSYTQSSSEQFDEEKIAASIMIERQINDNLRLGLGTRLEFLNLSEINEEVRLADYDANGEDRIVGMVGTLFYKSQTKDSAGDLKDGVKVHMTLLPSYADQGAYLKTFATVMGGTSLGENDNGVSHTLSGRVTIGYASENAPFHEKFYAGGAGTLRGFERKSIATEDGDGGQVLISGSTAYSFPIWEKKVKGVIFVEAASVGDNLEDLGNVRAVGGIGVKANLMDTFLGSMIEVGVTIPLRKEEGDDVNPFYFIFGDYDPAYDL